MGSEDWKQQLVRVAPSYAKRLAEPLPDDVEDTLAELRDVGIDLPEDLVAFLATFDDGDRLNLQGLGGQLQHLHDLYGVLEANHPDEGTYGNLVAEGEIPQGVVMIGYGMTQLLYDGVGALGPKGSYWSTSDMSVDRDSATQLATSLVELLRGARPMPGEHDER